MFKAPITHKRVIRRERVEVHLCCMSSVGWFKSTPDCVTRMRGFESIKSSNRSLHMQKSMRIKIYIQQMMTNLTSHEETFLQDFLEILEEISKLYMMNKTVGVVITLRG